MRISKREYEILFWIAHEKTSQEIGNILFLSSETVKSHRKALLDKLAVKNAPGLVRKGFELGLLNLGQSSEAR